VWDWSAYTPKPDTPIDQLLFKIYADKAYNAAYDHDGQKGQSGVLAAAINSYSTYKYIHLIGHSAGAKLIHEASKTLAEDKNREGGERPFIYFTFLDAYTQDDNDSGKYDRKGYGYLEGYPDHYAEHFVDIGLWYTDACLASAFNFNITDWRLVSHQNPDEREGFGHQWPRWWYEHSVTSSGFKYGYPLSLEGSGKNINELAKYPAGKQCHLMDEGTICDILNPPDCW